MKDPISDLKQEKEKDLDLRRTPGDINFFHSRVRPARPFQSTSFAMVGFSTGTW